MIDLGNKNISYVVLSSDDKFVYIDKYKDLSGLEFLEIAGVKIEQLDI